MISLKGTEPFTPEWLKGDPRAPVYHIRVGDVIERGTFEAELASQHRAGQVFQFQLLDAFTNGVNALLADDPERDSLIELVTRESSGEPIEPAERQILVRVRDVMAAHWPEYAMLLEQASRRNELAPVLAFRRFVIAIDREADDSTAEEMKREHVQLARGLDGMVRLEELKKVPSLEMKRVGNEVLKLLYATDERRNFPQPTKSADAPTTSPSASVSKEAGKSGASSGKKTRASRSRRGSGR